MTNLDLDSYKISLLELVKEGDITEDTASTYYYCIKRIKETAIANDGKISAAGLKEIIVSRARSKEAVTNYMAAIRKYEEGVLQRPKALLFGEPESELYLLQKILNKDVDRTYKYSPNTVLRKINALRNKKLKYALRLQIKSGLRVKEISEIRKQDIVIEDNNIKILVKQGKGRKDREVDVLDDPYLAERLGEFIKGFQEDDRLFFSRSYLSKKADELGIKTHDLRRMNAKARFEDEMAKGNTRHGAKEVVKGQLGHEKISTTDIYLKYKYKDNGSKKLGN